MTITSKDLIPFVSENLGCVVTNVWGCCFLWKEPNEHFPPCELQLRFENGQAIRFRGGPDGEELLCDFNSLEPVDMQESGEIVICDLSSRDYLRCIINRRFIKSSIISSSGRDVPVGVRLDFEDKQHIFVFNCGDELYINADLPRDESYDPENWIELIA